MLHPEFPQSPYEIINPKYRWVPSERELKYRNYGELPPLVAKIREKVYGWRKNNYEGASDTSISLLNHWFKEEHLISNDDGILFNFQYYFAQREAVETIIYLHEIAEVEDKYDLLRFDGSDAISPAMFEESWNRFVIKMATGSGKTKVLSLIIAWSYFHKLYEIDSKLSRNFLIITPNIIVLDRIKTDFDGFKIFYTDSIIPDNGFDGKDWRNDFQLKLHIQDNVNIVNKTGNVFLSNIHRVYDSNKKEPSFDDEDASDYFLGERPVSSTTESKLDLDVIVRSIDELMILNDEAHHIHDKKLAWFKSIEDIHNNLLQKNKKLSMQVDFTATPKKNNGAIFPQTICDYPLVEAIYQKIVKTPVLPDKESRKKLKERTSAKYSQQYEDYLRLGYEEWKKVYRQQEKLNKKAVLFVMVDDTKNCDEVAEYLESTYFEFKNSVLVIHTKRNGEITENTSSSKKKEELEKLRAAANNIDSLDNPYKAIVSVLVLKEGWDVKNVTIIVGLRGYTSKSNILPEQTLGRGLRRMYRDFTVDEKVSVIGTDRFMEFIESIESEGVSLNMEEMNEKSAPKSPIIIEIDTDNTEKDMNKLDIKIPISSPRMIRKFSKIQELDISNLEHKRLPINQYTYGEDREITFKHLHNNEISHVTRLNESNLNPNTVIGFFTQTIMKDLRIFEGYDILYGKLKEFIKDYLFVTPIDLNDKNIIKNLSEPSSIKSIIETFEKVINNLIVQDIGKSQIRDYIKVTDTRPFIAKNQVMIISKKSVFNYIIGDSNFEIDFATFLEKCEDIISYTKNYLAVHFNIEYQNKNGEISNYYPDFIIKRSENKIYIVETKGFEAIEDINKIDRLEKWCEDINAIQKDIKFDYVYVTEEKFNRYEIKNFDSLIEAFIGDRPL
ncbi:MAG: DEAD/DEAH box helicase family protein [Methanobrevibacter sp.]|jgi:type III restriction enzyme|nr:DEAD/DEAH box helicase family protein [Candidatus Methanovirga procula]